VHEHYVLHYPFKWLSGFEHDNFIGEWPSEPEFKFELKKTVHGDSEIVLGGLPNRPFAEGCVFRCWFALMCFSFLHHRPCKAELALSEPEYVDPRLKGVLGQLFNSDFSEVDSKVLGMVPYVRGSGERVKRLKITISGTVKRDAVDVAQEIQRWMWHPQFFELINDSKLRLALDLANLIGFEAPKQAKFILIISAVEALLPESEFSPEVQIVIKDWQTTLRSKIKRTPIPEEAKELQLLLDKTAFLQSPSISARFKSFASAHSPTEPNPDYLKLVSRAYTLRSDLVHKGWCDEDQMHQVYPVVYDLLRRAVKARLGAESAGATEKATEA